MDYLVWGLVALLNLSYAYFWGVTIYARKNGHIARERITPSMLRRAFATSTGPKQFVIQITTRGGSLPTVLRGISNVLAGCRRYPILRDYVTVEIITEDESEAVTLNRRFAHASIPVKAFVLPRGYQTPNGTQLKARALHYMVELHRENPRDSYIVHYDEESVYTPKNLGRLVHRLLTKPIGISEGSISYGLDWEQANIMCRTMESSRPFGCHECYLMMTSPPPLHLHGSNLVIQEKLENQVGWDIGVYRDNPLIAEDLVFGLMAYTKFGGEVFGWHGVEMIEQPPFTIKAAYKQRERWVMGALQGVAHVSSLPAWQELSRLNRFKIAVIIRLRVLTYALGFPVSAISLMVYGALGLLDLVFLLSGWPVVFAVTWLTLPGLVMWLGSTQLGLAQNLRYVRLPRRYKLAEHLIILALTPFAGIIDTAGPMVAVLKWSIGKRSVKWVVTPKLSGVKE